MGLIRSEDLFFFFREHLDFRTKFGLRPRNSDIFLPIRKVLENHDLGKCHKISLPPNFLAGTPLAMKTTSAYFQRHGV